MDPDFKTPAELAIMREGGAKLGRVKTALAYAVAAGVNAAQIEALAQKLIAQEGAKPSFAMVPGYKWATCINVNDGIVHGIPEASLIFDEGDIVSIDVGVFYKGFHTDTSTSVVVGNDPSKHKFLEGGRDALTKAIAAVKVGATIGAISKTIEQTLASHNLTPVKALVGHGIGRQLHEAPYIPCFVSGSADEAVVIRAGMALAIEVMYTAGSPDLVKDRDGWTIRTKDGTISGLFEESVIVTNSQVIVITS